jgi:hypothetical protein
MMSMHFALLFFKHSVLLRTAFLLINGRSMPHGIIFYDVIALTHCTVVCDTGTTNLPNRLLDIKI